MGYRLNRLDEPVFMAGPKPMRTEFGIHHRLESCAKEISLKMRGKYTEMANTWLKMQIIDEKDHIWKTLFLKTQGNTSKF